MSSLALRSTALVLLAVATLTAPLRPQDAAAPARRPNILFLFADDQRSDSIGAYGSEHAKTPHIDALAARGFVFTQNHCMGSRHGAVCAPSRAMMLSGRTLHRVSDDLRAGPEGARVDVETWPQRFRAAGYRTFGTGKWHNGRAGFERSFDEGRAVMFGGMSDHNAVPIVDMDSEGRGFTPVRSGEKHSSELFADAAIEFLERHAELIGGEPFVCYTAFTAPHDPRDAPVEYRQAWAFQRPPLPANFRGQHGWMIDEGTLTLRDEVLAAWPRNPEVVQNQLGEYYALIEHLDFQVGRILSTLDRLGLTDDTLVVYSADHGLALGSHGLLGKQSLYQHSMGCPLIFAGPEIPVGGKSDALTYLFDIPATLCRAADGVRVPQGIEGVDLGPIMRGIVKGARSSLFTLYKDNMRAVRDQRFKLIRFTRTGKTLLFDLENDPDELHDLAGDPAHAANIERLLNELRGWQESTGDTQELWPTDPLPMTIDLSGRARTPDRWQPEWIVEKYFRGG